jgi:hypothetical protein
VVALESGPAGQFVCLNHFVGCNVWLCMRRVRVVRFVVGER